jgi:glycosyltransferase involved in cell wall biosynthesis
MIKNRVSIIIPCYNQEQYLLECLRSVVAQTHEDIEIIVVDDGSIPVINPVNFTMYSDLQWVEFLRQENKGLPGARNAGIKAASGEWILPLDADDKIHPAFIERALKMAEQAHIVSTGLQQFGNKSGCSMPPPAPTHKDFLKRNQINCCSLYRKSMWEKIGGYDERMKEGYEDYDFWLRATAAGYIVRTISEPLFYYRKRGTSLLTTAQRNRTKIMAYMRSKFPNLGQV